MEDRRLLKEGRRCREADGVAGTGDIPTAPQFIYSYLPEEKYILTLFFLLASKQQI
jgi:hypothetical protein